MILPYQQIKARCFMYGLIQPWQERTVMNGKTFGLSSAGYDVRIAQTVVLSPGACELASTVERIDMQDDIIAQVADKSTWARRFLTVQNTIIEPGWEGFLTLELVNHSHELIVINEGDPIAQLIFMQLSEPTEKPYSGKYQNQPYGPQPAINEQS